MNPRTTTSDESIPVVDISALLSNRGDETKFSELISQIKDATQRVGFFYISNHGVSRDLQDKLETISRIFFALPLEEKRLMDMSTGGKAWRGYFGVGDELTSGIPDQKEGKFFICYKFTHL